MTAEVCLLNRYAAVLAADSATTASYWDEEKQARVEQYFKGANKVFQLSRSQPVGLMIYGNAALHSVPWEVLVKEFRADLEDKKLASPHSYAGAFFDFLKSATWLFEAGVVEQHFIYNATVAALSIIWNAPNEPTVASAADENAKRAAVRAFFEQRRQQSEAKNIPAPFALEDVQSALNDCAGKVAAEVDPLLKGSALPNDLTAVELAEFGIRSVFKTYDEALSDHNTGIVVAGFGEKELFPSFCEYNCYGFVRNKLAIAEGTKGAVTQNHPAHIRAFAQTSMLETFMLGFSKDVYSSVRRNVRIAMGNLADEVRGALAADAIPERDKLVEAAIERCFEGIWNVARKVHRDPLYRIIGHLPVAEMAELAETMISLQSLKERVTQPSQSVGGPVDVAVITRAEGLVWIKRKHYFDPELNPRFMLRLGAGAPGNNHVYQSGLSERVGAASEGASSDGSRPGGPRPRRPRAKRGTNQLQRVE